MLQLIGNSFTASIVSYPIFAGSSTIYLIDTAMVSLGHEFGEVALVELYLSLAALGMDGAL